MKKNSMADRLFKKNAPCFIIAEISANHGQNFKRAISLIRKAKECGADAVKFQSYTPDTLTIDVNNKYFRINHPKWGGQTLYELYKKAYTPWKWFGELKYEAERLGLLFFSTAFDKTSVDFLESLDVKVHKIASFEIIDTTLIKHMAQTGKPLILSTGMASLGEIRDAVDTANRYGVKNIILLKCVSSYPSPYDEMNLKTIPYLKDMFGCNIGISDHTIGGPASVAAVALGANVVERHFTLSRSMTTPDSFFSLEPGEFKNMVDDIRLVEKALGHPYCGATKSEKKNLVFRRSLFAVKDIAAGERITDENVRSIRPGNGMPPKFINNILGKKVKIAIKRGTPLTWKKIDEES